MSEMNDEAGRDAVRRALSKANASIRLEGEVVHRTGGGIAVRRGGSIFEAEAGDIIEVKELEGGKVAVLVKADGQLIRSTAIQSRWIRGGIGWRPVFDDCSDCTECSVCSDCTECSVCSDCTECSVCSDCTECSVCAGGFGGLRNPALGALSAWIRLLGGAAGEKFGRSAGDRRRSR